jgi:hypothetical protein
MDSRKRITHEARTPRVGLAVGFLALTLTSCGAQSQDGATGGKTSWLGECHADSDCQSGRCIEGLCETACQSTDCEPSTPNHAATIRAFDAGVEPANDEQTQSTTDAGLAPTPRQHSLTGDTNGHSLVDQLPSGAFTTGALPPDVASIVPNGSSSTPSAAGTSEPGTTEPNTSMSGQPTGSGATGIDPAMPDAPANTPSPHTPPPAGPLQWIGPSAAQDYRGMVDGPAVAIDALGYAVAVWRKQEITDDTNVTTLESSLFDPVAGWGDHTVLTEIAGYVDGLCLAGNADGTVVASWTTWNSADLSAIYNVWSAVYTPGTGWNEAVQLGGDSKSVGGTFCAIGSAGDAMIAWGQYDGTDTTLYTAHRDTLGAWGDTSQMPGTSYVGLIDVAMAPSGDAAVIWTGGTYEVPALWTSRYTPSDGWSEPFQMLTQEGRALGDVSIDTNDDGALAAWSENSQDGAEHQAWSSHTLPKGDWSLEEQLDDGSEIVSAISVGLDASGNALAVWEGFTQLGQSTYQNELRYARYTADAGWQEPQLLQDDAGSLRLSMSSTGMATAVWVTPYDYTQDSDIAAKYFDPESGWSDGHVFTGDPAFRSNWARVATNDSGMAAVVWQSQNGDGASIWTGGREPVASELGE